MSLFDSGQREGLKGAVHGALGLLALVCCGYNVIAWARRRDTHLAVNASVYGALTAYELAKVLHHRDSLRCASAGAGPLGRPHSENESVGAHRMTNQHANTLLSTRGLRRVG